MTRRNTRELVLATSLAFENKPSEAEILAAWQEYCPLAQQLGLHGLVVPEAYGGQGFGFVELGLVPVSGQAVAVEIVGAERMMGGRLGGGPRPGRSRRGISSSPRSRRRTCRS